MPHLLRTTSAHPDFIFLVQKLDAELVIIDGDDHDFYHQYNHIDNIKYAVVLYEQEEPVGCGAIKAYGPDSMEVKRMYVVPEKRGKGLATHILQELEQWAAELSFKKCILETGIRQADAVRLYKKNGYSVIPNYGQYAGVENSVCFEKVMVDGKRQTVDD